MPDPTIEVIGVHPVEGVDCFLIEVVILDASTPPDFGQVTQRDCGLHQSDWQVAYGEVLLDAEGTSVVADLFLATTESWSTRARVAFYLHNLDLEPPIITPFGDVPLPPPTAKPDRLSVLQYEEP